MKIEQTATALERERESVAAENGSVQQHEHEQPKHERQKTRVPIKKASRGKYRITHTSRSVALRALPCRGDAP